MQKKERLEKLRKRIVKHISNNTPKGMVYPTGVGWSLWDSLFLSEDEGRDLLEDPQFFSFLKKKCGGISYAYKAVVLNCIYAHPALSDIIISSKKGSRLAEYKSTVIQHGIYKGKLSDLNLKDYDVSATMEYIKICDIESAKLFLKNPNDKIRLEAYYRVGILSCAEEMARDKSAKIRAIICQYLPYEDPLLNIMKNDRSKWVFSSVLKKIEKGQIPMMLGSVHLKQGFVSSVLKKRMQN